MRAYSDLILLPTFEQRFKYLQLHSEIGIASFGFERFLNQSFYHSKEWKTVRNKVIVRDDGCDLGIIDHKISGPIRVHHLNPISVDDFESENFDSILDPEFLISVSLDTHNAIHYGTPLSLKIPLVTRTKSDNKLW